MNSTDTITITVPDYDEYQCDDSSTIDLSGITSSTMYNGGISPGYGAVPSVGTITIGNTGSGYTIANPTWSVPDESSIKLGEDFSIVAPKDGPAKIVYKNQEVEIGQLFGMVNAFKILLKSVAEDPDFCNKHPAIRDMAYGYLIEELKR